MGLEVGTGHGHFSSVQLAKQGLSEGALHIHKFPQPNSVTSCNQTTNGREGLWLTEPTLLIGCSLTALSTQFRSYRAFKVKLYYISLISIK